MRDFVLAALILGALPVCVARPWIGVLMWSWIGFMNPHRLLGEWTSSFDQPYAQMVAIATLAGFLFSRERQPLPRVREVWLLLGLWLVFLFSTVFAVYPDEAWPALSKISKVFLMTFLVFFLLQEERKVRALIWVTVLSIGFFGIKGGIFAIATGAQYQVLGPADSFMAGNTEIALALNMIIPLLVFLKRDAPQAWVRHLLRAAIPLCGIAVVSTYSRGGFLGLAVVGAVLLLKSRMRLVLATGVVAAFLVGQNALPGKWFTKMETIRTYEEDQSAMGRIHAWRAATNIALDRPLLGAGFRPFTLEMYQRYYPHSFSYVRDTDAHSIFYQVLAEHGFTGLALYAGLIASTFLRLRSIIRQARRDVIKEWIGNCAQMLEASFIAYVASGLFLSRSYFDLFYTLVAITVILHTLVSRPVPPEARLALPPAPQLVRG
jgi:probable O-glycosylation ligase (exosortase A-associated)